MGKGTTMNLFDFSDSLRNLLIPLAVLIVVAQLVYLLLPDEGEPVDEIRAEREKR